MQTAINAGHVAFFTNQIRTIFFAAIAARLRAAGVRVSWLSTSHRWTKVVLEKAGAAPDDILDLWKGVHEWRRGLPPSDPDMQRLKRIEQAGGLSIKNMIIMDREFNRRPWRFGLAYLATVARLADEFFDKRGIDLCIGEATWCGELLISQLARLHGITYAASTSVRIPSENFGFFDDPVTDHLVEFCAPQVKHFQLAHEVAERLRRTGTKPYYMSTVTSPFAVQSHWANEAVVALFSSANRFDYTIPSLLVRVCRRVYRAYNALTSRGITFAIGPSTPDVPYILVTLHFQPESSVDVLGAPFNDQVETTRALSRIVPVDYEILVKEHRPGVGCRSFSTYHELARISGVRLIHHSANMPLLIKGARLVASPSGTACYEAALMGVPAVCFGRIFFGEALICDGFDPFGMDRARMAAFLAQAHDAQSTGAMAQNAECFLARVLANSFVGRFGDPTDPESLTDENLSRLAWGLLQGLAHIRKPDSVRS